MATGQSLIDRLGEFLAGRFGASGVVEIRAGSVESGEQATSGISPEEMRAGRFSNHMAVCQFGPGTGAEMDVFIERLSNSWQARCLILAESEESPSHKGQSLSRLCQRHRLPILFAGLLRPSTSSRAEICIIDRTAEDLASSRPDDHFRPLALLSTYNDEDIIGPILKRYLEDGIQVHVIDNWSSDRTIAHIEALRNRLVTVEKFPFEGPAAQFDLYRLLLRKEELALQNPGRWIIHTDSDEIRCSPWLGLDLREAIAFVDRAGFNCIDFTGLEFRPVDNNFVPGTDLEAHFICFEFNRRPGAFRQQKVWKQPRERVTLADSGGHIVEFRGKRLYPYKFFKKHYPFRSQQHGERKALRERQLRLLQERESRGWHGHYDRFGAGHNFLDMPGSLTKYDEQSFRRNYLIPLISGIGILE
jgi:hypothetical protein